MAKEQSSVIIWQILILFVLFALLLIVAILLFRVGVQFFDTIAETLGKYAKMAFGN